MDDRIAHIPFENGWNTIDRQITSKHPMDKCAILTEMIDLSIFYPISWSPGQRGCYEMLILFLIEQKLIQINKKEV